MFQKLYNLWGLNRRKSHNLGFSVIELFFAFTIINFLLLVVLICMNFVQSSRTKSFITEFNVWKKTINTFYVIRGRLPGDINNDGFIGECRGQNCGVPDIWDASTFPHPYNGDPKHEDTHLVTPFIELYLEGLIKFIPDPSDLSVRHSNGCRCASNTFPKGYFWFESFSNFECDQSYYLHNTRPGTINVVYNNENNHLSTNFLKKIDKKFDDGIYNTGELRVECDGINDTGFNSHDEAIKTKKSCKTIAYKIL